jgi:hypothetical protein
MSQPAAAVPQRVLRYAAQAALYALFAAFVGYFSTAPTLRLLGDDEALLRLSLLHPGKPKEDCRKRTPEELAKLPPQMRAPLVCPRERSPVRVRVELDGTAVIDESFAPAGLAKDGASAAYRRLPIAAGPHRLRVQLNDDARRSGFTHERTVDLEVKPGRIVLIDFDAERGGVLIK